MNNFFIYRSQYSKRNFHGENVPCSVTVLFCDGDTIGELSLQAAIKEFYATNYQTDEIVVIGGRYNQNRLEELFIANQLDTFKHIPKMQRDHLAQSLSLLTFDASGSLACHNKPETIPAEALKRLINDGMIVIFTQRGGLIEATGDAHHFVFPSGKHCNKFLRTGNILLHSSEIYFIAFNLLRHLDENNHKQIYCDTSSINTLAFALLELKRKLLGIDFKTIPVESFSSYDGLFSRTIKYFGNSLILVSSSTSANIISRITQHDENVDLKNIVILYFLGHKSDYTKNRSNIVCNITSYKQGEPGIEYYDTFSEKDCIYCKTGSYPVEVKGDIFLLEKPRINRVTIKVTDAPKRMSEFINQFKARGKTNDNVLKANYKENRHLNIKYELYFDMYHVLTDIETATKTRYPHYKNKLFDFINQYIPSNTKYLISLPDEGSEKLMDIIYERIKLNYKEDRLPKKIKFGDISSKVLDDQIDGAAVVVASCISNGKNLLYLSRALRPYDKLKLTYFIGLARTHNLEYLDFLKSNLKQGNYGKDSNTFVNVESFFCTKDSVDTSWIRERNFIKDLLEFIEDRDLPSAEQFLADRLRLIEESWSTQVKGLSNSLFYPQFCDSSKALALRKNFAFFNFKDYVDDVSEADVYFSISTVFNCLRYSQDNRQCLRQSEYVRNVIDPGNFNRFNDGIIQASILRAARPDELSYHIDESLSTDMKSILEKIIEHSDTPQGEALYEFLYAIANERLTLKKDHLTQIIDKIENLATNDIVKTLSLWIKTNIIPTKSSMADQVVALKAEIETLRAQLVVQNSEPSVNPQQH